MSLACLVCHGDSPTNSFRSYSVSSSDNEGRCSAIVNCLTQRVSISHGSANTRTTSKVTPAPILAGGQAMTGAPRLVRSHAVTRDLVRDWNFEELLIDS
ncbi:hypothetical protein DsansV1_C19g0159001 [Dioscorea sansibarensis]